MQLKLKLKGKMLLYILGTTLLLYMASLGFISFKLLNISKLNAFSSVSTEAKSISNEVGSFFKSYTETAQGLAKTMSKYDQFEVEQRRPFITDLTKIVLQNNPSFYAVWSKWSANSVTPDDTEYIGLTGSTADGSFAPGYYKQNGEILSIDYNTLSADRTQDCELINETGEAVYCEPTEVNYANQKQVISGIVTPIVVEGQIIGIVGVDVNTLAIQSKFGNIKNDDGNEVYIISNQGIMVSCPDSSMVNKPVSNYLTDLDRSEKLVEKIKSGKSFQILAKHPKTGKKCVFAFEPIQIHPKLSWSVGVCVPGKTVFGATNKALYITVITGLIGLLILTWLINAVARSISEPLKRNTRALQLLAEGRINKVETLNNWVNDEISDISQSINQLVSGLGSAANFANQIGAGNLNEEYKLLGENDSLGNSLIKMRESLKKAKIDSDNKKILDEKRNWVTHGLAKFGEIIRQDNNDIDKFSMNVIKNLAEYLNAAQIAIYINDKNEFDENSQNIFHLKAAIAYKKPVKITKDVEFGKELIGYSAMVNKVLVLENLPENYAQLSPGMKSHKKPTNLLISPISNIDTPLGVFEILSYNQFEPHHIEFIEKLSENIAAVIASVKVNIRTAMLLEQSQFQADELAQHEEEMRQNLEEMLATQEEAQKRYNLLHSYIKAVKGTIITAELDLKGRILDVSPALTILFGASRESMLGNFYDAFTIQNESIRAEFSEFWEKMLRNGKGKRMQLITQRKKEYWLLESYMVIKKEGLAPRVLLIIADKSRLKELNDRLKDELKEE